MSITDDPELAALQRLLAPVAARRRVAGVTKDPVAQVAELRAEVERLRATTAFKLYRWPDVKALRGSVNTGSVGVLARSVAEARERVRESSLGPAEHGPRGAR